MVCVSAGQPEDLAPIITHLFNASYEQGVVPGVWKAANVVPIPKAKGAAQPSDMRPVSLLPTLAKLLERCILKRLLPSITPAITDQYAYMKSSSTVIAVVKMVQSWLSALDSRDPVVVQALFADMSKAFDRVDHAICAILIQRVIDTVSSPCMISWLHDYLRGQRVMANGKFSSWLVLTSGVPQGGVLSPYLFLLFMASRTSVYSDTLNIGYADDVNMSRTVLVRRAASDTTMSAEAARLDSWSSNNNMLLNGKKSQALHISFSRSIPVLPPLVLGGEAVPTTTVAKGLGFTFDNKLTWNDHIKSSVTKASSRLHYLRLLCKQGIDVDDLLQVYKSLIRPVLEYGNVLLVGCSAEQSRDIERVQKRALRIISCGGKRTVPYLPSLKERRELAAITLLKNMMKPEHPLHELVPPQRLTSTGRRLRNHDNISLPLARTERLRKSFLYTAVRLYNETL
ncbi:hypothetical protein Bbelb_388680 [Branchiostoma belcheri]|nr:hypothetical protein Bbelb_388680 [Branchiostoma belcheri]